MLFRTLVIICAATGLAGAQSFPAFRWIKQVGGTASDAVVGTGVDATGNIWNWCQEQYRASYPDIKEGDYTNDKENDLQVNSQESRVLRGGSFVDLPLGVRAAGRTSIAPTCGGSLGSTSW